MFAYPFPSAATSTAITFSGGATINSGLTLGTALTVANGGTGVVTLTGCLTGNGTGVITGSGTCNTSNATVSSVGLSDSNSTLTIGGTPVTTSGTLTATLNLGHTNTWTVPQYFNNFVGVATTTPSPSVEMTVSSSSASQVLLTGSVTDSGVAMREAGNHFYISTTSPTTYATTSPAAVDINMNSGTTVSLGIATTSPFAIISAVGTGSTPLMAISSSTATASGMPVLEIDQFGHQYTSGALPTLSSCGTTPSVTGNDTDMIVTVGSVSATGCTITFAHAYATAPVVTISNQSMSITNAMTFTVSTSAITITQTALTSAILDIYVRGTQ
jgi:hypothetical protein